MSEILDIDRLARGSVIDAPLVIKDEQGVRPYKDGNFFTRGSGTGREKFEPSTGVDRVGRSRISTTSSRWATSST